MNNSFGYCPKCNRIVKMGDRCPNCTNAYERLCSDEKK